MTNKPDHNLAQIGHTSLGNLLKFSDRELSAKREQAQLEKMPLIARGMDGVMAMKKQGMAIKQ